MDEFFFLANDFLLLESYQLDVTAKCKASNCCKIEADVFCKKGVLKNLAKFTGKLLSRAFSLIKLQLIKQFWRRCFPMNIAKLLRTPLQLYVLNCRSFRALTQRVVL